MRWLGKERFRFLRGQGGIGLIETVVALAILGLIGVAFLSGLTTTSRAVAVSQERVIAESLAKSQLEYIKAQDYISVLNYDPSDNETSYDEIVIPPDLVDRGYAVEISVSDNTVISAGRAGFELQSITVAVKLGGKAILSVSSYRVGLAL